MEATHVFNFSSALKQFIYARNHYRSLQSMSCVTAVVLVCKRWAHFPKRGFAEEFSSRASRIPFKSMAHNVQTIFVNAQKNSSRIQFEFIIKWIIYKHNNINVKRSVMVVVAAAVFRRWKLFCCDFHWHLASARERVCVRVQCRRVPLLLIPKNFSINFENVDWWR